MKLQEMIDILEEFSCMTNKVVIQTNKGDRSDVSRIYLEDYSDGTYIVKIVTE